MKIIKALRLSLFLVFVFALFLFFSYLLTADEGITPLESQFVTFDNVLLSPDQLPEDFSQGRTGEDHVYWSDQSFTRVRTSVMDIALTEGEVYGLFCQNLTYAARVWVNGQLLVDQGQVSETPEGFIPKTDSVTAYFTAQANNRIVVQRCNFNHAKWNLFRLHLGPQQTIIRYALIEYIRSAALIVFLLTVGLINLGMAAGLPGRKQFLYFALSCFCILTNYAFANPKPVMLLFPDLDWYVGHKIEACGLILGAFFLLLFFQECFGQGNAWVLRAGAVINAAAVCYYVFLPSTVYTVYAVLVSDTVALYAVAACLYYMARALKHPKALTVSQRYYLLGVAVVAAGGVLGALRMGPYMELLGSALILFEIILTLGLAQEFLTVQRAYEQSAQRESELRQMNEAMERSQELQENFLAIMNHEMRTPLTVIAGYADKAAVQIKDENAARSLRFIKQEALRLGRIVEQSEESTAISTARMEEIDLIALLRDVQAFCAPICEKRKNALSLQCPEGLTVHGVRDSLLQALYNLVINASRHTQAGAIMLSAEQKEQEVILSVRDSGDGMDEETLLHAFDRGFTRDGGHGIGLALCREIAEYHGGRVWIEKNEPEKGITVLIALPAYQEAHKL